MRGVCFRGIAAATAAAAGLSSALALGAAPVPAFAESADEGAPVAGARTAGDSLYPAQGNGGYDVTSYDLDLTWSEDKTLTGTADIAARVTGAPLSELTLDLRGLEVEAVSVDGVPADFAQVDSGPSYKLVVRPSTPISGEVTITVEYGGTPTAIRGPGGSRDGWVSTADGAVALNLPTGTMTWAPVNNTTRDAATWDVAVTVPDTFRTYPATRKAISNGVLVGAQGHGDGTTTWRWREAAPTVPSAMLLVIGVFDQHDGSVRLADGRSLPTWDFVDYEVYPGITVDAGRAVRRLERTYGDYPGTSTGVVLNAEKPLHREVATQGRIYLEGRDVSRDDPVQQVAYQFFGTAVAPTDWGDRWIAEAAAGLVADDNFGPGAPSSYLNWRAWKRLRATDPRWRTPVAGLDDAADLDSWAVRERGTMALQALRTVLGRGTVDAILKLWVQRYAGTHASTADFIDLAEEVAGRPLDGFFRDWLYDTDKPAWPSVWGLGVSAGPRVTAGGVVPVRLSAVNRGREALRGGVVEVDAGALLRAGRPVRLPGGVTRRGSTLRWAVPTVARGARSVVVPIRVRRGAVGQVVLTARAITLGARCESCDARVVVLAPVPLAPRPGVHGAVRAGRTLLARPGRWSPGTRLSVRWLRDGVPVPDARGPRYHVRRLDVGHRLRAEVTGRRAGYGATVRVSRPTSRVRGTS